MSTTPTLLSNQDYLLRHILARPTNLQTIHKTPTANSTSKHLHRQASNSAPKRNSRESSPHSIAESDVLTLEPAEAVPHRLLSLPLHRHKLILRHALPPLRLRIREPRRRPRNHLTLTPILRIVPRVRGMELVHGPPINPHPHSTPNRANPLKFPRRFQPRTNTKVRSPHIPPPHTRRANLAARDRAQGRN